MSNSKADVDDLLMHDPIFSHLTDGTPVQLLAFRRQIRSKFVDDCKQGVSAFREAPVQYLVRKGTGGEYWVDQQSLVLSHEN